MRMSRAALTLLTAIYLAMGTCVPARADPERDGAGRGRYSYGGHPREGEYKESDRDGPCKVEREQKKRRQLTRKSASASCKGNGDGHLPSHRGRKLRGKVL